MHLFKVVTTVGNPIVVNWGAVSMITGALTHSEAVIHFIDGKEAIAVDPTTVVDAYSSEPIDSKAILEVLHG